jgi:prephenate dehydrogenase
MKQPLVVGYKGEIGSFILGGLLRIMPKALDIWCVDINETREEIDHRIEVSDTIFLCTPLEATVDWLIDHKDKLNDKVIIEQCSLKEWVFENALLKDLDIRSMHILFRPSQTPNKEDRRVGFFKDQFNEVMEKNLASITQSAIVWFKDAKEHDKEMAVQQALLHRTLLILGRTLKSCKGSTYISQKVVELETRIRKGNKNLYERIQENKYLPEALGRLKKDFEDFKLDDFWK